MRPGRMDGSFRVARGAVVSDAPKQCQAWVGRSAYLRNFSFETRPARCARKRPAVASVPSPYTTPALKPTDDASAKYLVEIGTSTIGKAKCTAWKMTSVSNTNPFELRRKGTVSRNFRE